MTRKYLIDTIKEYFEDQISKGKLTEAPNARELAYWLIRKGAKVVPVEVGDKVYNPDIMDNAVYEYTVVEVDASFGEFTVYCKKDSRKSCFAFESIGKYLFLSRNEAENELRKNRANSLRELLKYYISEEEWDEAKEILALLNNA